MQVSAEKWAHTISANRLLESNDSETERQHPDLQRQSCSASTSSDCELIHERDCCPYVQCYCGDHAPHPVHATVPICDDSFTSETVPNTSHTSGLPDAHLHDELQRTHDRHDTSGRRASGPQQPAPPDPCLGRSPPQITAEEEASACSAAVGLVGRRPDAIPAEVRAAPIFDDHAGLKL